MTNNKDLHDSTDQNQMYQRWDGEKMDHGQELILCPICLYHVWRCWHEQVSEMNLVAENVERPKTGLKE